MRSQLIIFLSLLAAGCATQRRCLERWPPQVGVVIKDTTIYKDTILYVTLPTDTVLRSDTVYITAAGLPFTLDTLITETDFARALAWVTGARIFQKIYNKDTALELRYDSLLREKQKTITLTETIQLPPKYNGILWQIIAIAGIILLIILAIRIRSGWP
jgi:hypothetical protein